MQAHGSMRLLSIFLRALNFSLSFFEMSSGNMAFLFQRRKVLFLPNQTAKKQSPCGMGVSSASSTTAVSARHSAPGCEQDWGRAFSIRRSF